MCPKSNHSYDNSGILRALIPKSGFQFLLMPQCLSTQVSSHVQFIVCETSQSTNTYPSSADAVPCRGQSSKREPDNLSPACLELPVKAASIFCQIFLGTITKRDNKVGNMFLCLLLSLIFTIKHPTKISNSPAKMHYHMQYTRN